VVLQDFPVELDIQVRQVRRVHLVSQATLDSQVFLAHPELVVYKALLGHLAHLGFPVIRGLPVRLVQLEIRALQVEALREHQDSKE